MRKDKILFVEDDENILNSLSLILEKYGYQVMKAADAETGLELISSQTPDLILLDLNLPGMSGGEFAISCRNNRNYEKVPIIVITGYDFEDAIVDALEQYADDYLTKPVKPRVLKARLHAVLRRTSGKQNENDEILDVNIDNFEATLNGKVLNLTRSEFYVLKFLYLHPNQPFSREQIIKEIRGNDYHVESRSIDYLIFGIRKKLGENAHIIETVRGVGFRYKVDR